MLFYTGDYIASPDTDQPLLGTKLFLGREAAHRWKVPSRISWYWERKLHLLHPWL